MAPLSAAMEDRGGTRWEIPLLPCQKGGESNKPRSGSSGPFGRAATGSSFSDTSLFMYCLQELFFSLREEEREKEQAL